MSKAPELNPALIKPIRAMIVAAVALFLAPFGLTLALPVEAILIWAGLAFVVILAAAFVMLREAFSVKAKPQSTKKTEDA